VIWSENGAIWNEICASGSEICASGTWCYWLIGNLRENAIWSEFGAIGILRENAIVTWCYWLIGNSLMFSIRTETTILNPMKT